MDSKFNSKKIKVGIKELKQGKECNYLGPDSYVNKFSYECALMAAGASVECCKSIFKSGTCDSAFAAIRPPGHHSNSNHVGGFCFFNNVALAAKYLQDECGIKKVTIFDWDAHCGDGTLKIFIEDDTV